MTGQKQEEGVIWRHFHSQSILLLGEHYPPGTHRASISKSNKPCLWIVLLGLFLWFQQTHREAKPVYMIHIAHLWQFLSYNAISLTYYYILLERGTHSHLSFQFWHIISQWMFADWLSLYILIVEWTNKWLFSGPRVYLIFCFFFYMM